MPVILDSPPPSETDAESPTLSASEQLPSRLPFPPVMRQHILNCSFHAWWARYRNITPKARLIPLNEASLGYLRADGIVLPDDNATDASRRAGEQDDDSGFYSSDNSNSDGWDDDDEEEQDVTAGWEDVHKKIQETIQDLGGAVMPKLNWSAPKDATWINANSMECRTAQDIYLLLKSSDFVTHDLEHAFDDTAESASSNPGGESSSHLQSRNIPYHLVLRKHVPQWNPSMEFRCFVRHRQLLAMCQRDLNHFDFLPNLLPHLRSKIQEFFDVRLRDSFPDENFAFDVYVPKGGDRVWLVDINPWAPRTDPLLFSWLEILEMEGPSEEEIGRIGRKEEVLSIPFRPSTIKSPVHQQDPDSSHYGGGDPLSSAQRSDATLTEVFRPGVEYSSDSDDEAEEDADEEIWQPEFRLVRRTDPEAYNFSTPQYSAHKLPKDVVDASQSGQGLREFAREWKDILDRRQREEAEAGDSDVE